MLFEKPALDSRKLASQKGNNLILSNLDKEGNIVIPPVLCDCEYVCCCVLMKVLQCALVQDCPQACAFVCEHKGF